MKIVIYTCVTRNYDSIRYPIVTNDKFDYIYLSDHQLKTSAGIWKYQSIPELGLDKQYLSRHPKLLPHLYFPDYDYSIYIDANIQITGEEFYSEILKKIDSETLWCAPIHPERDSIYDEGKTVVLSLKAKYFKVRNFLKMISKMDVPHHLVMTENNILIRQHNHELVKSIDEQWWQMFIQSKTRRDQLSLPVIFWKNNFIPNFLYNGKKTWEHAGLSRIAHPELNNRISHIKRLFKDFRMRTYLKLFGDFDV